ncbi:Rhodanese-like domain-containing protein [Dunaliella salina]|uniref:Rhodanese-like domain-containing protein n=1 Tax=Dunaliella salina TaxID=3046 RepID=A0ABQ7GSH4_DUNSA|nr:Rhodanese-like domain-containing protein [Dunaliella salina]|eukprot:KAF5837554.1 Rhodanese-like domain-containing protein [Dunaliella salina]
MLAHPNLLSTRSGLPARHIPPLQHTPAAQAHSHIQHRTSKRFESMLACSSSKEETKTETQSQQQDAPAGGSLSGMAASQGNSGIAVQGYSPTSVRGWAKIQSTLREANVKLLSAQELTFARERGVPIIDIRPPAEYEQAHIPGAVNVPFYQPITGWSAMKIARRAGYALFGVLNGTEVNQEFTQQVAQAMKPDSGAILYCSMGGSLEPVEKSKKGLQSRSLIAAWKVVTDGYPNVSVLRGGWSEWINSGREVEGGTE